MINKISSRSELHDMRAIKMAAKAISKRAGGISTAEELAESAGRIMKSFGPEIEKLTSEARIPLMFIEDASDKDVIKLGQKLMSVRGVTSATNDVLAVAKGIYPEATTYDEFLALWIKDFSDMSKDLHTANGKMTVTELDAFYLKYKKAIDSYKLLKESATVNRALSAENIAKGVAAAEKAAIKAAPKTTEEAAAAASKIQGGAKDATKGAIGLALGTKALGLLPVGLAAYGFYNLASWLMGTDDVKNEVARISAAIGCIDAIKLTAGSPAAKDRDIIINNLKAYLAKNESSQAAQASLTAGAETEGSILHFVSLINSDPGTNLTGFASWVKTDTAIAAMAGGATGFALGGILGAAVGATLAGGAGWFFVSTYYKDQLNCLSGAVDAIASISRLAAGQAGGKSTESSEGFSGPSGTSAQGSGILAKILTAMSQEKLVGKRGPNLINEKAMVNRLLERATSPEIAAVALIHSNYNISQRIKSDAVQNIVGAIDRGAVRANAELKDLMQDIIDTIPNAIRSLEQGQIKTSTILHTRANNMKKLSTSTNTGTIKKKAEDTKTSYFGDAASGLSDSLTKSYYAGLTSMYNEKLPSRPSDYKDTYGFQDETGQDLIQQSHSKSVTLADAMGKGGLVENGLEQQEKSHYIATSTPSGNLQSKYAQTLNYLTKLAKAADDQGKKDVSQLINQTIKTLK